MTIITDIRRSYKYRLYRHDDHRYLVNGIDIAGIIWNHSRALQKRCYRLFGGLSRFSGCSVTLPSCAEKSLDSPTGRNLGRLRARIMQGHAALPYPLCSNLVT